jgi:hypothetical protein
MKKILTYVLTVATLLGSLTAQVAPDWTRVITPTTPTPPYGDVSMAYDTSRDKVVMLAGTTSSNTWEYNGVDWTRVITPNSPPVRNSVRMVYDVARGVMVMFGGRISSTSYFNDTWEYDGVDWTEVITPISPPPRMFHAMTYDTARGVTIMHGGYRYTLINGHHALGDTWEYDGSNWVEIITPNSAGLPKQEHQIVYDISRGVTVMFGGRTDAPQTINVYPKEVYEYDGVDWTMVPTNPTNRPGQRSQHAMAYDYYSSKVVLVGGYRPGVGLVQDTWEYDSSGWTRVITSNTPPAANRHSMAYRGISGRMVMFGGQHSSGPNYETWEYSEGYAAPGTVSYTHLTLPTILRV